MRTTHFLLFAVLVFAAGALVACNQDGQGDLGGAAVQEQEQGAVSPIEPTVDPGTGAGGLPGQVVQPPDSAVDTGKTGSKVGSGSDTGKDEPEHPPVIPGFEDAWAQILPQMMLLDEDVAKRIGAVLQPFRGEVLDYMAAQDLIANECPDCIPVYEASFQITKLLVQDPDLTPAIIRDARARGTAEAFAAEQPVAVPDLIDWIEDLKDFLEDLE